MKFRYILILLSSLWLHKAQAQDTLAIANVQQITCMSIDAKGNYFIADNQNSLLKYNAAGELITNVNIKSYGVISHIDCSNPFELYVFYQEQNIIVFYDNMLNLRGEIRLNDHYFNNVSCIARSFDNNIWLIDLSEYKLLKIDKKGKILLETPYLNNILGSEIAPYKIWEYKNKVLIADSLMGIHQLDMNGTYTTTYYFSGATSACSRNDALYVLRADSMFRYHIVLSEPVVLYPNMPIQSTIICHQNRLFTFQENKIISYPADL